MIYDRNQFIFNIVFVLILACMLVLGGFTIISLNDIKGKYASLEESYRSLEEGIYPSNNIQSPGADVSYLLTPEGFFVYDVDDFGTLSGPSMQPTIFDGNTMIQKKYVPGMNLSVGDVVRYMGPDGNAVIHRIRGIYASDVYVQGDNLKEGERVPKSRITHKILGVLFT
jgi:hypothetical protein